MSLPISDDAFERFAQAIRTRESGDQPGPQDDAESYGEPNSAGYLGAYQFGLARICDLTSPLPWTERVPGSRGWANRAFRWRTAETGWDAARFLADHGAQDRLFRLHVADYLRRMKREGLDHFVGEQVSALLNGEIDPSADSVVTRSGMLAAAHLRGWGGLRALLYDAVDLHDGNGTHVSDYMRTFAGYF